VKYLVANLEGHEAIFVFPRAVDHDRMAEALASIRFGYDHNWSRKLMAKPGEDGKIISAGFVTDGVCHGRSETLGLKSREADDSALLRGEGATQ
jgi:hypothetical protein